MSSERTYEEISKDIEDLLAKRVLLARDITEVENQRKFLNRNLLSLDLAIKTLDQERAGQKRLF